MPRKRNIFHRVASENENTITEIIVNLMRWKYIRDVLLSRMNINDLIDNIDYDDISTQVTIKKGKRPDIVIKNKDIMVFIENKIYTNTQLQDSQWTEYYEALEGEKQMDKRMVFIIPKNYQHEAVINATSEGRKPIIETIIIYWNDILDDLMKNDIYEANTSIKESIEFIQNTIGLNTTRKSFAIGEAIFMFNKYTLKNVTSLLLKTQNYTEEALKRFLFNYKEKFGLKEIRFEFKEYNVGTWIIPNKNGEWLFFLGYSFNYDFDEDDKYLFNLKIHETIIDKEKIQACKDYYKVEKSNWYMFPVPKNVVASDQNVPNEIYSFIESVINAYCR